MSSGSNEEDSEVENQQEILPSLTLRLPAKKSYFNWTDDRKYSFVKACRMRKVHLKDSDIPQKQKWELVLSDLKANGDFIGFDADNTELLKKKFSDEKK